VPAVQSRVLDNGLNLITTTADKIYICSQEPADFISATSTYALGNKNFGVGNVTSAPTAATPNGRQVNTNAFNDGAVTATGTAAAWAIVDTSGSNLLTAGSLNTPQAVTSGNTFALGTFSIALPSQ